jgi:hypothetical protein
VNGAYGVRKTFGDASVGDILSWYEFKAGVYSCGDDDEHLDSGDPLSLQPVSIDKVVLFKEYT